MIKYIDTEVEIDVDIEEFDDDELLDEVEHRAKNDFYFKEELLDRVDNFKEDDLAQTLESLPKWVNQEYAKEYFKTLEFSEGLIAWILKNYAKH